MDFLTAAYRVGLFQIVFQKDSDTSDKAALNVPWRILAFFVVPNWFLCTDTVNDETSLFLDPCSIPSNNLSSTPSFVSKVYHLYQFQ